MVKWEYGELYKGNEGSYCFNGYGLTVDTWDISNLIDALNRLGEEGWEFVTQHDSGCDEEVYIMKRIK